MKKALAFLLLVASLAFAEDNCQLDFGFQIFFQDSSIWYDGDSFPYNLYTVIADTISETLPDGYRCYKNMRTVVPSPIDSNIIIYYPHSSEKRIYLFSVPMATHGIGDAFKDEFLHWQQCGMLNMTYEEADSLIEPMAQALNNYLTDPVWTTEGFFETLGLHATDLPVPFEYPQLVRDWTKKACAKAPIAQVKKNGAAGIVLENGLAHIPERLIGQKYFIFDMNGRVIQAGIAKETIRMPLYPVILKVGNEKPFLSKN
ncbi:MAG: hypothetical protein IKP90_03295 [Fibrobacter sp.]|nr:hypothetical protein [Fibrobacter sp.]MBR4347947.1 hypothetical protein [Fibrobacter sp.]